MAAISSVWHWSNQQLHDPDFKEPFRSVDYIKESIRDFQLNRDRSLYAKCFSTITVAWTLPPSGWVKVNVNGVVSRRNRQAACGGLIRSTQGDWITSFMHHVGCSSILVEELWAICQGLHMTWAHEHRSVIIETDSAEAIYAIQQNLIQKNALNLQGLHEAMLDAPPWLTVVLESDKQGETEERRKKKHEEVKMLENSHFDYYKMKMIMQIEIAGLLEIMEATKQQWV
ncbi:Protein TITANIA [Camellia lanceoleosa]|uniref:Protein TITANIA n=1 Tax=Camellia lanceoleosa TaxID=1840588 RepID=A0ACC0J3E0_9ERIC|nr:Protein TITANIA [Camellia lanceoleosa]